MALLPRNVRRWRASSPFRRAEGALPLARSSRAPSLTSRTCRSMPISPILPLVQARLRPVPSVPMLTHGKPIGAIAAARREVRPFSNQQIALLRTFANQAVIAIENVRLFTELRERTAELTRSVEQLTALGE